MSNPFAYAIIVHHLESEKRGKWLSGAGLSTNRIHAECWPNKKKAQEVARSLSKHNPSYRFTVRKFG